MSLPTTLPLPPTRPAAARTSQISQLRAGKLAVIARPGILSSVLRSVFSLQCQYSDMKLSNPPLDWTESAGPVSSLTRLVKDFLFIEQDPFLLGGKNSACHTWVRQGRGGGRGMWGCVYEQGRPTLSYSGAVSPSPASSTTVWPSRDCLGLTFLI